MGKTGQDIKCDMVVLCTGAHTARVLSEQLRVFSPLLPVKGYSLEMDSQSPNSKTHLMFEDSNLQAGQIGSDKWQITGFGDMGGSYDFGVAPRRVRQFRNTTILTIDKKEGLKSKDIKTAMRTCSPDDLPVIGALKHYPNILVNGGHGSRSIAMALSSGKLLSEIAETGSPKDSSVVTKEILSPHRFQM